MRGKRNGKHCLYSLYIYTRHNECCAIIEFHFVDFSQPLYEQRNKKPWETISIAENERKENCEIKKAFQNK